VNASGDLHVAYCDVRSAPLGYGLKYAQRAESGWDAVIAYADTCETASLALDSSGTPHIAYHDLTSDGVKRSFSSGSGWVADFVELSALNPSLTIDESDTLHVAYTHRGPYVDYAFLSGTIWVTETVDGEPVAGPSIAVDASGTLHVAYCDVRPLPPNGPGEGLKYARRTESGWVVTIVDRVECGSASLALDPFGHPSISYYDTGHGHLKYAYLPHYRLYVPLVEKGYGPARGSENY
jgi:hypothetical protein